MAGSNCTSKYEGRLEVCQNNIFSTVCDDGTWGEEEATVVCRQLNFINGSEITDSSVCQRMKGL